MGIRIPTGFIETTISASKNDLLLFQCTKCKKETLLKYPLQIGSTATYHAFQTKKGKKRSVDKAGTVASQKIYQQSAHLANAINITHDYEAIDRSIICPHCGHRQEWSAVQQTPSMKSPSGTLSILYALLLVLCPLLFAAVLASFLLAADHPILFIPIGIVFFLLVLFGRKSIQKKRKRRDEHSREIAQFLDMVQSGRVIAPIYYNESNLAELLNGPYRELY